ncbi:MAG: hypothetical protein E7665_08190 [Ruminococcaceae bacterium]|nr:hypothetical protein [Oscillospiraceae bacterium]
MKLIFKFKRLISIALLAVMMSTMLIVPASAYGDTYSMGGVAFTRSNGSVYAWGNIWSYGERNRSLAGEIRSTYSADLTLWLYIYARNMETREFEDIPACFIDYDSTLVEGYCPLDPYLYEPSGASADFYVDSNVIFYEYEEGWNPLF